MNASTALMVIDVQMGMFAEGDPVFDGDELLRKLSNLIARARAAGVEVIFVQHSGGAGDLLEPGGPGWSIHPTIAPQEVDLVVHKLHPDSFQDTILQTELVRRGIRRLVVAGIQSEFCVDTTCRRAYSLGYDVTLVQDAHSTWNNEILTASQIIAHENKTLSGWFVRLEPAAEIAFYEQAG